MAAFAIFNYQFCPNNEQAHQGVFEGMEYVQMTAREAFDKKQTIFGDLLLKDFKKVKPADYDGTNSVLCFN